MVRTGSNANQACIREDAQPVRTPPSHGEFANAASSTGPRSCSAAQRDATSVGVPASRHTWTAAVEHIMARPIGPIRSKAVSIAV
jgi:hypothetical protein